MTDLNHILTQLHGITQEEKLLKLRKDALKQELESAFELGDVDKSIEDTTLGISASRTRTTTYQHSQECRDDITKLKNFDIELGHATKKETYSWTIRKIKERPTDGE